MSTATTWAIACFVKRLVGCWRRAGHTTQLGGTVERNL